MSTNEEDLDELDDPDPCTVSGDCVVIKKTDQVYILC